MTVPARRSYSSPFFAAQMTRSTRLREPVLVNRDFTWVFTVVVATTNLRAISSLESPWQTRFKISCSRGVNWVPV